MAAAGQVDDDERTQPHPSAVSLYRDKEIWKRETTLGKVEDWNVAELRSWIEMSIRRSHPHNKYDSLVQKLLKVMEEEDISGDLLVAGGKTYLAEKASLTICNKRDQMRMPHAISLIFSAVEEAIELQGVVPYWDRMVRGGAAGHALCEEFQRTEGIGRRLRLALEPHPLEAVHYAAVCHMEAANSVTEADEYVRKNAASVSPCFFKVVSVAPRDNPSIVWSNLIYVRTDLAEVCAVIKTESSEGTSTETANDAVISGSRKQRRKKKHERLAPRWELLASVDFSQHGSALPGHWHLNRSSCGGVLPHLCVTVDGGFEGADEVWHGGEDCCPLWWQFIPDGMVHKSIPQRLKGLLEELEEKEGWNGV